MESRKTNTQEIKTNENITYIEARKFLPPPLSQTYYKTAKSSITSSSIQMDENITKIKCSPLELLEPVSSISKQNKTSPITTVSTSSSTSTISESQPPIPKFNTKVPLYLANQAIVKKSRKQLLHKYTETSTPPRVFDFPNPIYLLKLQCNRNKNGTV
ncbi:hypothetical protein TNCV_4348731 [Trichonephila clavipes]|nr:hypothetical protein TNCV_4348731 [Trichonephila clavipes]